jgi:NADPH:quinone reductase-like Zn-dependent oxidoreductase
LFEVAKSGAIKIEVHQTYPLKDAAKAQSATVHFAPPDLKNAK